MDRFSKTTEIDTAEIAAATMEDDTPKKSKASNIIALVICILIAILVWVFVMETDTSLVEKQYRDVYVYATVADTEAFDTMSIIVKSSRRNLIDLKSEDFKVVAVGEGVYKVYLTGERCNEFALQSQTTTTDGIVVTVIGK
jgi:hypothetical protein